MPQIFHALTLHLHQPPNNLQLLIETNPKEAEQIIHCYDRITRFAHKYINIAHFHVAFSGLLLQQLQQPKIIKQYSQYIDIPAMLKSYRLAKNIELLGVGMYHPIFPLIAPADWEQQLKLERDLMLELFGRAPRGFLPPEMAFSMQMIPTLVKTGYEYVLIDAGSVQPEHEQLDVFQPYIAQYQGEKITVIPMSRDISSAQQTGLDPVWLAHEVQHQVWHSARPESPRLLSTWSNGENKRWFRLEEEGFFGRFVAPYVEHAENGEYPILPVSISDYLKKYPAEMQANIEAGAWNTGSSSSGYGLTDWGGSDAQRKAITKIREVRQRYEKLTQVKISESDKAKLAQIRQQILIGQSSCFIFWGDEWIQKLFDFLQPSEQRLSELESTYFKAVESKPKTSKPVATTQPLVLPKKPTQKTSSDRPLRPSNDTTLNSTKDEPPIVAKTVESSPANESTKPLNQPIKPRTDLQPVTETKSTSRAKATSKTNSDTQAASSAKSKSKTVENSDTQAVSSAKSESKTVENSDTQAASSAKSESKTVENSDTQATSSAKSESKTVENTKKSVKAESTTRPVAQTNKSKSTSTTSAKTNQATTHTAEQSTKSTDANKTTTVKTSTQKPVDSVKPVEATKPSQKSTRRKTSTRKTTKKTS